MTDDVRAPRFAQLYHEDAAALRDELLHGLHRPVATVSPKFLYDRLGSRLFDAITELPEYYPTRTEAAIFRDHGTQIAAAVGAGRTIVDLGAGNCSKGAALCRLLDPARYVAVDISADHVRDAVTRLQREHPSIEMAGVGCDFSARIELPAWALQGSPLWFYAGSSIGNFDPAHALHWLRACREAAPNAALLIGVDRVKPASVLQPAYADALGVTAAFNLNLLRHLNRLLQADFDPAQWQHVALWNAPASRVEMHLEARDDVAVRWRGGGRRFSAGERIHTENSYKYTSETFAQLLRDAGWRSQQSWSDDHGWFSVFLCHE